jgi:DnaK suppressor protein
MEQDSPLMRNLAERLKTREEELVTQLHHASREAAEAEDPAAEVQDFKDAAAQEATAAVDDAAIWHAAQELAQVSVALRRMRDGSYGSCAQCGDPIAEARLLAVPSAAFCTVCQADAERLPRSHH